MDRLELNEIITNMINRHASAEEVLRLATYSAASIEADRLYRELRIDELITRYEDEDGISKSIYQRVAVVATSQDAGHEYAEALGLKNYVVVTEIAKAQGMRMRAYVVTPAYLERAEEAKWNSMTVLSAVVQGATLTNVPRG